MPGQKHLQSERLLPPARAPAPAIWGAHKAAPEPSVRIAEEGQKAAKIVHDMNHSLSMPLVFADYLATRAEPESFRLLASSAVKSLQTGRSMLLAFMQVASADEDKVSGMLSGMTADLDLIIKETRDFVYSASEKESLPGAASQLAVLATKHLDKAADLLNQLRESPTSMRKRGPVDISSLLQTVIDLAARGVKMSGTSDRYGFSVVVENKPSQVHGDQAALERLFSNIVANALHAMPEGGEVRASVKNHGESVIVRITDSGTGMDEGTLSRVFQPYFTTKGGSGTGLGLAIARDVVESHGGEVTIKSSPGEGSTFRIALPSKR